MYKSSLFRYHLKIASYISNLGVHAMQKDLKLKREIRESKEEKSEKPYRGVMRFHHFSGETRGRMVRLMPESEMIKALEKWNNEHKSIGMSTISIKKP